MSLPPEAALHGKASLVPEEGSVNLTAVFRDVIPRVQREAARRWTQVYHRRESFRDVWTSEPAQARVDRFFRACFLGYRYIAFLRVICVFGIETCVM